MAFPKKNGSLIKICGLTREAEAEYLNENKADFAGFVLFFPKSRRNISVAQAKKIMERLDPDIKKGAGTVSPDLKCLKEIEEAGFDYVQIHGETAEEVFVRSKLPIIKAFNVSDMDEFQKYSSCEKVEAYVFDAARPGSGETFDWKLLDHIPRDGKPVLLAGGLNEENVAEAIKYAKPDGVDVSSSVEKSQGGKDPLKIKRFVEAVRCPE